MIVQRLKHDTRRLIPVVTTNIIKFPESVANLCKSIENIFPIKNRKATLKNLPNPRAEEVIYKL